jgi:TonB family protein
VCNSIRTGVLFLITLVPACFASTDQPDSAIAKAERVSSLTGSGAEPFHLKFTISEPANPKSPYTATVEEYWKSGNDWTRSIASPGFQQHIVVKDGNRTEENVGSYYPLWIRNFVTAAMDPLQDASFWEKVSARIVMTSSTNGHPSSSCARAQFKIGTAAVNNDAFAVICFNADGTLSSIVRPGYDMEFHDPRPFGKKKRIAYRYIDDPEPGTELAGDVQTLEKIDPSTSLPDLSSLTQHTSSPIKIIPISQDTFDKLLQQPLNIAWPTVHSGNTTGKLSMYVSVDRGGRIREAYPLNSDNAGLQDAARDQLLKLQLKPAVLDGQPVQTEATVTFQFSASLESNTGAAPAVSSSDPNSGPTKPLTVSQAIANSLRVKFFAPVYPQDLKLKRVGGKVELTAIIGKQGQVVSLTPLSSSNDELTSAAIAAVQRWTYKPYLLNGVPVEIQTIITVIFDAP